MKSDYSTVWQDIDLCKVWSAMEDSLNKAETPLAEYDSVRLSLKKYRNLGEINNKMNADEQCAFLMEEQRAEREMDGSLSPTENVDYLHIAC